MAFGTDESVLFREVSLIQGVLIERFHCIPIFYFVIEQRVVVMTGAGISTGIYNESFFIPANLFM